MKRNITSTFALVALSIAVYLVAWSNAKGQTLSGHQEVVTTKPSLKTIKASAPIPWKYHVRNEGGSDQAGLCVPSSILANGLYQGIKGLDVFGYDERTRSQMPGKGSAFWRGAKQAPGGYGPAKIEAHIKRTVPKSEKYASYVGTDPAILDKISRKGIPIGATMTTGQFYNWALIHHMISLLYYRTGGWACVLDNNDPYRYHWMLATEFARRWIDQGTGWAFWWLKVPFQSSSMLLGWVCLAGSFLFLFTSLFVAALIVVGKLRRHVTLSEVIDVQGRIDGRSALRPGSVASLFAAT